MPLRTPSRPIRTEWGVPDFKDSDDRWVRTKMTTEGEFYVDRVTRAGALWGSIHRRIKVSENYYGVTCDFRDFQEFASWCQTQVGYTELDDKGQVYEIDKDLLYPEKRSYSASTCRFVPAEVNCIFNISNKSRGELPLGVSFHKQSGKFQASGRFGSKIKYLGLHQSISGAHAKWQENRALQIKDVLGRYKANPNHCTEIVESIERRYRVLRIQILEGLETLVL